MSFLKKIDTSRLPEHVAIIMDGNGRWARFKNMERAEGHKQGVVAVRTTIEAAVKIGIKYITLYTFSTENWKRPSEEIQALMALMVQAIANETPDLIKNNVRLKAIGDLDRLPIATKDALYKCIEDTSVSTGLTLVLALSYSSRWEITEATREISMAYKSGEITEITEDTISAYLSTKSLPYPDLLIRTGGEKRVSNFLLWQIAYSELFFTDTLWPDFDAETLYEAVADYQRRERRFGKISEQIQ